MTIQEWQSRLKCSKARSLDMRWMLFTESTRSRAISRTSLLQKPCRTNLADILETFTRLSDPRQSSRRTNASTWHQSVEIFTVFWQKRTPFWSMCSLLTTQKTDLVLSTRFRSSDWATFLVKSVRTSRGRWPDLMMNTRWLKSRLILLFHRVSSSTSSSLTSLWPRTTLLQTKTSLLGMGASKAPKEIRIKWIEV